MNLWGFLNYTTVLLFGIVLTLSFSGLPFRSHTKQYIALFLLFSLVQAFAYHIMGADFLFKSYPLLIHFPLFCILRFFYKKSTLLSGIAVLSSYLFCTPRKWIGTFVSLFWNYDPKISYIIQILVTLPLILMIIRWIAPYVNRLQYEDDKLLKIIIIVPMTYYLLEYILTVYTDLLYTGGVAVIEFMDVSIVIMYFVFTVIFLKTLYEKAELKIEYAAFQIMDKSRSNELEMLKKAQKETAIYRHDMRHHLTLIEGFAQQGRLDKIKEYLSNTHECLNELVLVAFCQNETVNLILSSFADNAQKDKITFSAKADLPKKLDIPDTELCVILSNGIENALKAVKEVEDPAHRKIFVQCQAERNLLLIEIKNFYTGTVHMKNGIPISTGERHSFGCRSMLAIAERRNGLCLFHAEDGIFTLKTVLPMYKQDP